MNQHKLTFIFEVRKLARYICAVCGYVYNEEAEGTLFKDLPDDWICPVCGEGKEEFELGE